MKILAFDTSTESGSVAVLANNKIVFERQWDRSGSHAEILIPQLELAISDCKIPLAGFDLIATVVGPGSFTGIRVSINAAKSFSFVHKIPVIPFTLDQALALDLKPESSNAVFCLNAYNGLVFISEWILASGKYIRNGEIKVEGPEKLTLPSDFAAFGPGWQDSRVAWKSKITSLPWPKNLARILALNASQTERPEPVNWTKVEPLYLRAASAEKQKGM